MPVPATTSTPVLSPLLRGDSALACHIRRSGWPCPPRPSLPAHPSHCVSSPCRATGRGLQAVCSTKSWAVTQETPARGLLREASRPGPTCHILRICLGFPFKGKIDQVPICNSCALLSDNSGVRCRHVHDRRHNKFLLSCVHARNGTRCPMSRVITTGRVGHAAQLKINVQQSEERSIFDARPEGSEA